MASTYEPIATTTLGSAQATITLSSISGSYTDLRVVIVGTTATNSGTWLRFNNDSTTKYSSTILAGTGSAVNGYRVINDTYIELTTSTYSSSTIPNFYEIDIFSYAGSTYKTCLSRSNLDYNGGGAEEVRVSLYRSTSAITEINLLTGGANWSAGTIISIYGIKAA